MFFFYVITCLQVVLESVPVSSSGHVTLMQLLFDRLGWYYTTAVDMQTFDFLLHGPTIIILMIFFFTYWWHMLFKEWSLFIIKKGAFWKAVFKTVLFLGVVDGITFLFWWLKIMPTLPLTLGFAVTALLLYSLRYVVDGNKKFNWNMLHALCLGLVQGCSLMPGISRFGSTYACTRYLGYQRQDSFALSFLIQMPLIVGAFFKGIIAIRHQPDILSKLLDFNFLFVILSSSLISYAVLYWVSVLIERKKLCQLSWYMILPIVASVLL